MRCLICICIILVAIGSCRQKEQRDKEPAKLQDDSRHADTSKVDFFPVVGYLRAEISTVDSTPIAILRYKIENGHTDSAFVSSTVFHRLAEEFILPDLDSAVFEKNYSQKTFMDETSGLLTFTYSPLSSDLPLRRVDVLVNTEANNQVKSIYIEKNFSAVDTLIQKKMLWRAKKSFLIVTTLQPPGKPAIIRQEKVVWDSEP